MTFEEFFRKKKIDLVALEKAEAELFSEFKTHFEQMGEKSFDHSKKYWFNKLRRRFVLAPEPKVEKVIIENPVAEQTVIESLTETITPAPTPKLGFAPKFKAGNMAKPAIKAIAEPGDQKETAPAIPEPENKEEKPPAESDAPKPAAYKPRFKMQHKPGGGE